MNGISIFKISFMNCIFSYRKKLPIMKVSIGPIGKFKIEIEKKLKLVKLFCNKIL